MSLYIYTVTDEDIQSVAATPLKLDVLHHGELLALDSLEGLDAPQRDEILRWRPAQESDVCEVGAAFQSLHYLLTGETGWGKGEFPLNFLTGTRLEVGELGWGAATFYSAAEVKEISAALAAADMDSIANRYDPLFFDAQRIYPVRGHWTAEDGAHLMEGLAEVIAFMRASAEKNLGVYRALL